MSELTTSTVTAIGLNNSLTEAENSENDDKIIKLRKEVKQWLFTLIREFKAGGDKARDATFL